MHISLSKLFIQQEYKYNYSFIEMNPYHLDRMKSIFNCSMDWNPVHKDCSTRPWWSCCPRFCRLEHSNYVVWNPIHENHFIRGCSSSRFGRFELSNSQAMLLVIINCGILDILDVFSYRVVTVCLNVGLAN